MKRKKKTSTTLYKLLFIRLCWLFLHVTRAGYVRRIIVLSLALVSLLGLYLYTLKSLNSKNRIRWSSFSKRSWIPALEISSYVCPHVVQSDGESINPWTLHQVLIPPLTLDQNPWQKEWGMQGYSSKISTSVESMRSDVERLAQKTGDKKYMEAFEQLPRLMEKIDMWKYVILYLEGGIYADMDVAPKLCLRHLIKEWQNDTLSPKSSIFFYETSSFVVRFAPLFRFLMFIRPYSFFEKMNWDSTVRIPQFRSALILAKTAGQDIYRQTLDLVVQRTLHQSSFKTYFSSRNQQTLEVTGPGCFSDAINLMNRMSKRNENRNVVHEEDFYFIKREDSYLFFGHIATGSWR